MTILARVSRWARHARRTRGASHPGLTAAALALGLLGAGALVRAATDGVPPVILVLPPESERDHVVLRVQAHDPAGVAEVRLWVRSPGDAEYRAAALRPAGHEAWVARLPRPQGPDPWIAYWVEATDRDGNGPARNGSPEEPFLCRPQLGAGAPAGTWTSHASLGLLALPALVVVLLFAARAGRHRGDRPLEPIELERRAPAGRTGGQDGAVSRTAARPEEIVEGIFWFHLLAPLVDRPEAEQDRGLRALASRAHSHPSLGRRYFDVTVLRERLAHVRGLDPSRLFPRAAELDRGATGPPAPPSTRDAAGFSLVELLVAVAIAAALLGIGVLVLDNMAAPTRTGGELVEGLIRRTRAQAVLGTTVHRVRPLDADSLVVEHAPSCSSAGWTADPRLALELPHGVALAETAWSVCFNGRGQATENVILTLNHPDHPARRLEILRGGAVRWLP
jgi:prepilin-type N-terminal cleavage/methylation domain-containing protein